MRSQTFDDKTENISVENGLGTFSTENRIVHICRWQPTKHTLYQRETVKF